MDASALSYVSTPTGTTLHTPVGSVEFFPDEFSAYRSLFEIIDIDDDGRICFNSAYDLLKRSNVPRATLIRAWGIICANKDEDIVFEQWLVLCKVISHIQMNGYQIAEVPKILTCKNIPFLDICLRATIPACELPYGTNAPNVLDIDITGWDEVGEGMQKHVQYNVRYVTSLPHFSKTDWEVNRRYSDFKFLSELLGRYEGSLIPPLPPKHMINSLNQDLPAQRAQELNLFLKNIARHPALYGAYEFKIFLEASISGFEAFKSLIKKVKEIEHREKAASEAAKLSNAGSGPYGNSAGNNSSNITAQATAIGSAAVGYAWGMWSSVNKILNIPAVTSAKVSVPSDPRLEEAFAYTSALLNALASATAKMGVLLDTNRKIHHELSRISHYMRLAGELEGNRMFDRYVITTSKSIELLLLDSPNNLSLQTLEIYFHLQNLSRFQDVLKKNHADRMDARRDIDDRNNKVVTARKQLASVQKIAPGDVDGMAQANEVIKASEREVREAEQRHEQMMETTKRDLNWFNQVAKFELQGRVLGFVQMRAVAAQREVEMWENLLEELKGGGIGNVPVSYVEEEDLEDASEISGSFM